MLYPRVLITCTGLLALLIGLWASAAHMEGVGYARAKAEYTQAALTATEVSRTKEQSWQAQNTKASNDSKKRETKLLAGIAAADRQSSGLREQLEATRLSLPGLTRDAVEHYATTAGAVFSECTERYSSMATETERVSIDYQTFVASWPR